MKGAYARLQDCKVARFCLLRLNWEFTRTKLTTSKKYLE